MNRGFDEATAFVEIGPPLSRRLLAAGTQQTRRAAVAACRPTCVNSPKVHELHWRAPVCVAVKIFVALMKRRGRRGDRIAFLGEIDRQLVRLALVPHVGLAADRELPGRDPVYSHLALSLGGQAPERLLEGR